MVLTVVIVVAVVAVLLLVAASSIHVLKQYERGVQFRLGQARGRPAGRG